MKKCCSQIWCFHRLKYWKNRYRNPFQVLCLLKLVKNKKVIRVFGIKTKKPAPGGAFLFYGGPSKSLYEQTVINSYIINTIKYSNGVRELDIDVIKKEYIKYGQSLRKLSKKFKRSRGSIRRRLEKVGIDDFGVKIEQDPRLIEINTRSGVGKWFGKTVRDIGAITRW